ncbi:hypothetical protein [Williamsia muralis]|uniref:hypothetical protein n=1 Tax=Williamsia marianensis TaxID=85044 RepID=UPI0037FAA5AB
MNDKSILRNLDAQSRMLADIESTLDALEEPDPPASDDLPTVPALPRMQSYADLTSTNDSIRGSQGWDSVDLLAALTPEQRQRHEQRSETQRRPWSTEDYVAVGFAAAVGAAATWYDTQVDGAVKKAMSALKTTDLFKDWERRAKRLPIDYTGANYGGPTHRVRSAGHDLARPLNALRQIMDGNFSGVRYEQGHRIDDVINLERFSRPHNLAEALGLWAMHLAADVVTPMSLPMPGWTLLTELPSRDIRKFANTAYAGTKDNPGLNTRTGTLTPSLAALSTELIIRTHVHARSYYVTGSPALSKSDSALQNEMLLAAHSVTNAVSLGKATAVAMLSKNGALAIRHLNLPVLLKIAEVGARVAGDYGERRAAQPDTWESLFEASVQPWQFETAAAVEQRVAAYAPTQ